METMTWWGVGAWALAAVWAGFLVCWDLCCRRLPDFLTLPAGAAALIALWHPCGLLWPGIYLGLAFLKGGVGGGDIKLALPLGLALAHFRGCMAVILAVWLAAIFSLAAAALRPLARRAIRRCRGASDRAAGGIPHGPSMIAAALCAAVGGAL